MKKFIYLFLLITVAIFAECGDALPQSPASIKLRCPSPNGSIYNTVKLISVGDIYISPCPAKTTFFTQNVDFTGATVVGVGNVTNTTSTNTFFPIWNNSNHNLVNSPYLWNGSSYIWNNTALNATWLMSFLPSTTIGSFSVGDTSHFIKHNQSTGIFQINQQSVAPINLTLSDLAFSLLKGNGAVSLFGFTVASDTWLTRGAVEDHFTTTSDNHNTALFTIDNATSNAEFKATFTAGVAGAGSFILGDATGATQNYIAITNATGVTDINAFNSSNINARFANATNTFTVQEAAGGNAQFILNGAADTATLKAISGITINSAAETTTIGDTAGVGSNTKITIADVSDTIDINAASITSTVDSVCAGCVINENSKAGTFTAGDTLNSTNRTIFNIIDATKVFEFKSTGGTGVFDIDNILNFLLQRTVTAAGTTGNQTINKPVGTVNFAAAASDITVTNSMALSTSIILCTVQSADATAISCRITTKANGSFHILIPAATAETSVAFWVLN